MLTDSCMVRPEHQQLMLQLRGLWTSSQTTVEGKKRNVTKYLFIGAVAGKERIDANDGKNNKMT